MKAIVSPNIRIRCPQHFVIGEDSIIDDYCYFSTKLEVGRCSHIASGCTIAGGADRKCTIGDFCSISSGAKIWCTSDDFVNDLVTIIPSGIEQVKQHLISADVAFGNYTAVGSNAVIMPGNLVPDGTVIGALSFVPAYFEFQPWTVYAGVPIRQIRSRNRGSVEVQASRLESMLRQRKGPE
jgi:acetyltransferase-like isoleucine patch superfamily enzyme